MRRPYITKLNQIVPFVPQFRRNLTQSTSVTSKSPSGPDETQDLEHFFRYTSGRWLCDEEDHLRKRYLKFNVDGLKQAAALAYQSRCVGIEKLPEGLNNKVFSIALENGAEVIARLPNPNAGHPHYVVANEVATLDFLRDVAGIPVPKVLSWSMQGSSNKVGAEYLLMERAPGRSLSTVWSSMSAEQHFSVAKGIIAIEQKLAATALRKYGSIYFRHDCPNLTILDESPITLQAEHGDASRFVIGPVAENTVWSDDLGASEVNRGPWSNTLDYFTAVADREIVRIQKFGATESSVQLFNPAPSPASSALHVELLGKFLAVLPTILPQDGDISRAVLWHLDLHEENIFVDNEDPTKITSIIDWQNAWAAPLFMQARFPSLVDCPWPYPKGAVMPSLPAGFIELSEAEKSVEEANLRQVKLKKFYEIGSLRRNPIAAKAMAMIEKDDDPVAAILTIVGLTWDDGPIPLRELLIQIFERWDSIMQKGGVFHPCPISFTNEEIRLARTQAETWAQASTDFESLRVQLLGKDGWVCHEEYDEAKAQLDHYKAELQVLKKGVEDTLSAIC